MTTQAGDRLRLGWHWLGTGCFAVKAVSRDGWSTEVALNPARLAAPGASELPAQERKGSKSLSVALQRGCEQGSLSMSALASQP